MARTTTKPQQPATAADKQIKDSGQLSAGGSMAVKKPQLMALLERLCVTLEEITKEHAQRLHEDGEPSTLVIDTARELLKEAEAYRPPRAGKREKARQQTALAKAIQKLLR